MATQLSLYNGALRELGERKLASISENTEPRRLLDDVYTGALKYCLEQGHWKFAQRTAKLTYESAFTAQFGYTRRFTKPSDHVKWSRVCSDEYLNVPLLEYVEEAGFLFADLDDIYVSYVSNDASYGGDMTLWPETYVLFVEVYLASKIVKRLTQNRTDQEDLRNLLKKCKTDANSKDRWRGRRGSCPRVISYRRAAATNAGIAALAAR